MSHTAEPKKISATRLWIARSMGGFAVLFLFWDSIIKLIRESHAVEVTVQLGYPESSVVPIGIVEIFCLLLYVIPRTSIFGALLMTGYLGGAAATHARLGNPLFSHVLFSVYIAILLWGAIYLRDERLRRLIPFRKN